MVHVQSNLCNKCTQKPSSQCLTLGLKISNIVFIFHCEDRPTQLKRSQLCAQQYHHFIRRSAENTKVFGPWEQKDIANMDQTPLEFCFDTKGATYNTTGKKTVWCRTTASGHDKGQCTVQLTIFADRQPQGNAYLRKKPVNMTNVS